MDMKSLTSGDRAQIAEKPPSADASNNGHNRAWTIMVYLAGDNNLSDEMVWALKEIYRVGAPEGVAVTLQFDPLSANRSTRFYVAPSSDARIDLDGIFPILHDDAFPEVDSGNPNTVVDFVLRSSRAAPADHYVLILSGHGSGIVGDFLGDAQAGRSTNSLGIPDLGKAFRHLRSKLEAAGVPLPRGPMIDVLGLDSCLMSMAEVCSEVAGEVRYLIGSEGFDPNAGWPYFRLLEQLGKRTQQQPAGPEDLVHLLVDEYILYYSDFADADVSVDISACNVSDQDGHVTAIESAVRQLVDFYLENDSDPLIQNAVVLAHWRAQSYKRELYTDLVDFCTLLGEECEKLSTLVNGKMPVYVDLIQICNRVVRAVEQAVVRSDFAGVEFQHSHGLSVYFPWSRKQYEDDYRFTRFAARTHWDRFLERYVDRTRRGKRPRELRAESLTRASSGTIQPRVAIDKAGGLILIESQVTKPGRASAISSPRLPTAGATSSAPPSVLSVLGALSHRENAPSNRENAPSNRENAPSNRENAPSNRENAPSNRENAPSNRFAEFVDSLMNVLPSTMKNPPTEVDPVVTFTREDLRIVQSFKMRARKNSYRPETEPVGSTSDH
jgi:Clostripain family